MILGEETLVLLDSFPKCYRFWAFQMETLSAATTWLSFLGKRAEGEFRRRSIKETSQCTLRVLGSSWLSQLIKTPFWNAVPSPLFGVVLDIFLLDYIDIALIICSNGIYQLTILGKEWLYWSQSSIYSATVLSLALKLRTSLVKLISILWCYTTIAASKNAVTVVAYYKWVMEKLIGV